MPVQKIKVRRGDSVIIAKKVHRRWFSRDDWDALPPQAPLEKAEGPVTRIYFHYRTGTRKCFNNLECFDTCRRIQDNHIRRRMGDIAFNFLVASGGNIFEGRGYGVIPPPELKRSGPPGDRLDIAFIGDWTEKTLPYKIFDSGTAIISRGIEQGYIKQEWKFHALILKKNPRIEDVIKKKTRHKEERFISTEPFPDLDDLDLMC